MFVTASGIARSPRVADRRGARGGTTEHRPVPLRCFWRRGGVATQRPAKPFTPVRFRSSPLWPYAGPPLPLERSFYAVGRVLDCGNHVVESRARQIGICRAQVRVAEQMLCIPCPGSSCNVLRECVAEVVRRDTRCYPSPPCYSHDQLAQCPARRLPLAQICRAVLKGGSLKRCAGSTYSSRPTSRGSRLRPAPGRAWWARASHDSRALTTLHAHCQALDVLAVGHLHHRRWASGASAVGSSRGRR
jgi:hypothetical protein